MNLKTICYDCRAILQLLHRKFRHRRVLSISAASYNNNSSTSHQFSARQESDDNTYFITTPIFYVNAAPHIGHLYTVVLADVVNRWRVLKGAHSIFSTGTDEHGLKIQQAAARSSLQPSAFCDQIADKFKDLFQKGNISHTDFIRTTEERHTAAVNAFWTRLVQQGYIYPGSYEGWYCTSDETFLSDIQVTTTTDKDAKTQKVSCESGQPVHWMREENYLFRLSHFTSQLTDWINKGVIFPEKFERVVRMWLSEGLPDLSVSRQRDRLHWGIPVPGDHTQTVYVWLDALVNYLTVGGYPSENMHWPVDCHVVGKDILKFHAIYWPAFLLAAGVEPPRKILCHSHWTVNGEKMSKSRGNVIDPVERMKQFSADGLRYFLLKEGVPHSDGNYTDEKVVECINSDLVNTLGNLLQRCTSRAVNPEQAVPPLCRESLQEHFSLVDINRYDNLSDIIDKVDVHYEDFNIYRGLDVIMGELHWANGLLQLHKPWELAKDSSQKLYLETLLHVAMETLVICGTLLQPIIPHTADKLLTRLGVPAENCTFTGKSSSRTKFGCSERRRLGILNGLLFKRLNK